MDLKPLVGDDSNFDTICSIQNWENNDKNEYYFLRELTQGRITRKIGPYQSVCFGFEVMPFSQEIYKKTMETSNSLMMNEIKRSWDASVDSFQSSIKLKEILKMQSIQSLISFL